MIKIIFYNKNCPNKNLILYMYKLIYKTLGMIICFIKIFYS